MRTLLYDLETAPALGFFWGDKMYETDIIEIVQDNYILGFSWKWAHEDEVHWVGMPDFKGWKSEYIDLPMGRIYLNNKGVIKKLFSLVNDADFYIAHNGKNFDNRMANTAFLLHGLGVPDRPVAHDTKQLFKQNFRLPSNKLDEIGRILKLGRKETHTGKKMWFDCMTGNLEAWENMGSYAKQDVRLLEEIWEIVKPWMKNPPNWNLDAERPACCPACASARFKTAGTDWGLRIGRRKYRCLNDDCRHIWRGEIVNREDTGGFAKMASHD